MSFKFAQTVIVPTRKENACGDNGGRIVWRYQARNGGDVRTVLAFECSKTSPRKFSDPVGPAQKKRYTLPGIRLIALLAAMASAPLSSPANTLRPPAVPLVTSDPYFSIWSPGDRLAESDTIHWSGAKQRLTSLVRIDGRSFRLMGTSPATLPALPQVGLTVTATRSIYDFEGQGLHITLKFMSPLLPANLEVLSRPVTYLTWIFHSVDHKQHKVSLYYDNTAELVVNTVDEPVAWSRTQMSGLLVERMGSQAQDVLGNRETTCVLTGAPFIWQRSEKTGSTRL